MHNPHITRLAGAFKAHGKELYLVGGTVRDELMGRIPKDIDMATNARPDEIKAIAVETNPLHIVPIGEKFGTIQVHYPDTIIEITTYRGERYTPGSRHPEVQFGDSLLEDLRRRDFTINAIAKDALTGKIVDLFDGQFDLEIGVIRAVEDPAQRFRDDPLRMLRAVRFAAQFNFLLDSPTEREIPRLIDALATISQERIRDELCKILLAYDVRHGFQIMINTGLLQAILPEVAALRSIWQHPHHVLDVFWHTMRVIELAPERLPVRLAALLHDIAKPHTRSVDEHGITHFLGHEDVGSEMARAILRRLRFGNDVVEHVVRVVKLHMRVNAYDPKWSSGAVRRLYIDVGDALDDLLDLAIADGTSDRHEPPALVHARIEHLRMRLQDVHVEAVRHPLASPLNGDELMELFGRPPGMWIKAVKQYLHDLVVEGTLQADDKNGAIVAAKACMEGQEHL